MVQYCKTGEIILPKNKKKSTSGVNIPMGLDMGTMPLVEMFGNRRITIEGSTGILLYECESIKINTNKMVICLCGRGLKLRCISNSCVEIEGFITGINFLT